MYIYIYTYISEKGEKGVDLEEWKNWKNVRIDIVNRDKLL